MKVKLYSLCSGVASFSFIIVMFIICIQIFSFQTKYYQNTFETLNSAEEININKQDLMTVTQGLLDYIQDHRDDLNFEVRVNGFTQAAFNEKEITHMQDVKELYRSAKLVRNVAIILFFMMVIILIKHYKKDTLNILALSFTKVASIFLLILAIIAMWAIADFDSLWTMFHQIVFRNDLWLLNPATDLLIKIMQLPVFIGLVFRIVATFSLIFLMAYIGSFWYVRKEMKKLIKT